jgi:serine/threonine protein kinase
LVTLVYEFERLQELVLTSAKEIELGVKGRHVNVVDGGNHFRTIDYLGSGGSGEVIKALSRLSHQIYALKRFKRLDLHGESKQNMNSFLREIRSLKKLKHHHLVKIIGSYTDKRHLAILIQPVAECNLHVYLDRATKSNFPAI